MGKIFISYSRQDRGLAERVAVLLQRGGHGTWWDDLIDSRGAFTGIIEKELAAADAVLVLWTKASVQSRWVCSEADFALEKGKLVAARFEPCDLPIAFRLVNCIDLIDWNRQDHVPGWHELLRNLSAAADGQPIDPKLIVREEGYGGPSEDDWQVLNYSDFCRRFDGKGVQVQWPGDDRSGTIDRARKEGWRIGPIWTAERDFLWEIRQSEDKWALAWSNWGVDFYAK